MFGERRPSTSDPVLPLGCFLVHECDHLSQILSIKKKYLDMHLDDFEFSQLVCFLVCWDFDLAWVDFASLRFRTF